MPHDVKYWQELADDATTFILEFIEEHLPAPRKLSKEQAKNQMANANLATMMMIAKIYGPEEVARLTQEAENANLPQTTSAG